jgi:hypothetical protein
LKSFKHKRNRVIAAAVTGALAVSSLAMTLTGTFAANDREYPVYQQNIYNVITADGATQKQFSGNVSTVRSNDTSLATVAVTGSAEFTVTANSVGRAGVVSISATGRTGLMPNPINYQIIDTAAITKFVLREQGNWNIPASRIGGDAMDVSLELYRSGAPFVADATSPYLTYKAETEANNVLTYTEDTAALRAQVTWISSDDEVLRVEEDGQVSPLQKGVSMLIGTFTDRWGVRQHIHYLVGVGVKVGDGGTAIGNGNVLTGDDGKSYLDNGDNTFREVKDDGSLGDLICGGEDLAPGSGDDLTNVFEKDGNHYLDNGDGSYYNKGLDGLLGTDDDELVWPANDAKDIGDDSEPNHNETTTPPGAPITISGFTVYPNFDANGAVAANYNVASSDVATVITFTARTAATGTGTVKAAVWTLTGESKTGGYAGASATVAGDAATVTNGGILDNVGTITLPANYRGSFTIGVTNGNASSVTPASFTVTVDTLVNTVSATAAPSGKFIAGDKMWRVLAKNADVSEVLILSEYLLNTTTTWSHSGDGDNTTGGYAASGLRDTITATYQNQMQWAHSYAVKPVITAGWTAINNTTELSAGSGAKAGTGVFADVAFALSYADVLKTAYGFSSVDTNSDAARAGKEITAPGTGTGNLWLLRTLNASTAARVVDSVGKANYGNLASTPYGLRPALYLNLASPPPITNGTPDIADGRVLPAAKSGDGSDWVEIATNGGYSLIVRSTVLSGTAVFGPSGNNSYLSSTGLRTAINTWYANLNSGIGLRQYAVTHNALSRLGTFPTKTAMDASAQSMNDPTGFSVPTGTLAGAQTQDTAFPLSFQEAANFCSKHWQYAKAKMTYYKLDSSNSAKLNWQVLGDGASRISWLRSPGNDRGLGTVYATLIGSDGNVNSNATTKSYYVRPALWVKSDIFF